MNITVICGKIKIKLRGRRRGAKREAKDKEDTSLALSMGRWLVAVPPRTLQD